MPQTKAQKQTILENLSDALAKQKSLVLVEYKGMKAKDLTALRTQLKTAGAKLQVIKKTLFRKVLQQKGIDMNLKTIGQQIAAVFAFEDPFAPLKILFREAKGEYLKMVGGYIENSFHDQTALKELATLPSKEELRARTVRIVASPLAGFLRVLEGNMKGLMRVLAQAKTS